MIWIMTICIGASSMGCGTVWRFEYPSPNQCFSALAAMRTGDQPIAESTTKRNTVAVCSPKGTQ